MAFTQVLKIKAFDLATGPMKKVGSQLDVLESKTKKLQATAAATRQRFTNLNSTLRNVGATAKNVGRNLTTFVTLPTIAAGVASIKAFTDFEDGLIGVQKTTDLSDKAIKSLGKNFQTISSRLPISTNKLLEFAQVAGQFGIKGQGDIEKFSLVMSKLETASDITGEVGAKAIARILNVTGEGIGIVDQFGATLVDLGNNVAATESEILDLANRLAGALARFGAGTPQILGLSAAMKQLGVQSESGGTAIQKTFIALEKAVSNSTSKQFKALERLTGFTGNNLKKAFKEDAVGVFVKFAQGLEEVSKGKKGGKFIDTLEAFGLNGARVIQVLGKVTQDTSKLTESLSLGAKAFKENAALEKEFQKRTEATSAAIQLLFNRIKLVAQRLGDALKPTILATADALGKLFGFLEKNPTFAKFLAIAAASVAVLGPMLLIFGSFVAAVPAIIAGFSAIGAVIVAMAGPIGVLVAGLGAIIAFGDDITRLADPLINILSSIGAGAIELFGGGGGTAKVNPLASRAPIPQAPSIGSGQIGGVVDINIAGAPRGTRINATPVGPTELNVGQIGGLQ